MVRKLSTKCMKNGKWVYCEDHIEKHSAFEKVSWFDAAKFYGYKQDFKLSNDLFGGAEFYQLQIFHSTRYLDRLPEYVVLFSFHPDRKPEPLYANQFTDLIKLIRKLQPIMDLIKLSKTQKTKKPNKRVC